MVPVLLSLLTAALSVVGKLFEWLYAKQLVDAGRTQQQLENLIRPRAALRASRSEEHTSELQSH